MKRVCRFSGTVLFCAAFLLSSGCSTIINAHLRKAETMKNYETGKWHDAEKFLNDQADSSSNDEIMWLLEAGAMDFASGKYTSSIHRFNRAEERMEDYDRRAIVNLRSIGSESTVLLTNPAALPYRGFCRDRVLYPIFRALCYLGKKDEAAFRTELFKLRENQDKVIADYEKFFKAEEKAMAEQQKKNKEAAANCDQEKILSDSRNAALKNSLDNTRKIAHRGYGTFLNPFAIFMSAYGYACDNDYENALVDYKRLYQAMPANPLIRQYYKTALIKAGRSMPLGLKLEKKLETPLGRGSVLVIFANGKSAALRQFSLYIPIIFPGYASVVCVAWPLCEYYQAPFSTLQIKTSKKEFSTVPIADMDAILAQEYSERLPGMITRIVLSTAVKEFGSYAATRAAFEAHAAVGIIAAIGAAAYKATFNTADTRTWEILPKEFQIAQFAMPADRKVQLVLPGMPKHEITLPSGYSSAIVYVTAPGTNRNAVKCLVFPLK